MVLSAFGRFNERGGGGCCPPLSADLTSGGRGGAKTRIQCSIEDERVVAHNWKKLFLGITGPPLCRGARGGVGVYLGGVGGVPGWCWGVPGWCWGVPGCVGGVPGWCWGVPGWCWVYLGVLGVYLGGIGRVPGCVGGVPGWCWGCTWVVLGCT